MSLVINTFYFKIQRATTTRLLKCLKLKMNHNKCWWGCGAKELQYTLICCSWKYKMVQPLWKIVWKFLKKQNFHQPYDSTILLLDIYPKEIKICTCTKTYIQIPWQIICNNQKLETTQMSKWIDWLIDWETNYSISI